MESFQINLMSLVLETNSNANGEKLYKAMAEAIEAGKTIELSLLNATPFSTSFLNTSFGALYENYGEETLKGRVKITNFQPTKRDQIINYLNSLRKVLMTKTY